jgi:hypothetical protein
MTIFRLLSVLSAFMLLASPQSAEAQLGGLIKKKVKEAIKPPEKTDPAPQPAAAPATATKTDSRNPNGFKYFGGAVVISSEMLARLTRGLNTELAMENDFEKDVARYPTQAQYDQCQAKALMSPEGQKVMDITNYVKPGASSDEAIKGMQERGVKAEALVKKSCPLDPKTWSDYNRREKLREIHKKASEAMFTPGIDTAAVISSGIGVPELEYSQMIERLGKYCELKKTIDVTPKPGGLKYAGDGQNIYWVWSEDELTELQKFDCEAFFKKYAKLLGIKEA